MDTGSKKTGRKLAKREFVQVTTLAGLSLRATNSVAVGAEVAIGIAAVVVGGLGILMMIRLLRRPPRAPLGTIRIVTQGTMDPCRVGEYYERKLNAVGGLPPYTWSMTDLPDNVLPPGLVLEGNKIKGTPTGLSTSSTFLFRIDVTDGENSTNQVFGMQVLPAQQIIDGGIQKVTAPSISGAPDIEAALFDIGMGSTGGADSGYFTLVEIPETGNIDIVKAEVDERPTATTAGPILQSLGLPPNLQLGDAYSQNGVPTTPDELQTIGYDSGTKTVSFRSESGAPIVRREVQTTNNLLSPWRTLFIVESPEDMELAPLLVPAVGNPEFFRIIKGNTA